VRSRGYRTNEMDFDEGRGVLLRELVGRRRGESIALLIGVVAGVSILVNALFLQKGQHPAPLWAGKPRTEVQAPVRPATITAAAPAPDIALPRARPATPHVTQPVPFAMPVRSRAEIIADIQRELSRRGLYDGAADGVWGAKTETAIRDFAISTGLKSPIEANEDLLRTIAKTPPKVAPGRGAALEPARNEPAAETPAPPTRVAAVQSALAEFGYGQIKPTGVVGPETQAAIETFERDRKLPVTGQLSERVTREIAAVTGRPLD